MKENFQPSMYQNGGKRALDVVISACGIILLLPILLVVAMSVLLRDGRPVLFKQPRIGINRHKFNILKFRTMSGGILSGSDFDAGNRSRVTRNGAFLRKTKLDELPQLFNVLVGEMSIVGPRPEVERWTLVHKSRWDTVLSVRPGITDRAAVEFRNEEELLFAACDAESEYREVILPTKLDYCEEYVSAINFCSDAKIVLSTIKVLFR